MFTQESSYSVATLVALAVSVLVIFVALYRGLIGFQVFWNG